MDSRLFYTVFRYALTSAAWCDHGGNEYVLVGDGIKIDQKRLQSLICSTNNAPTVIRGEYFYNFENAALTPDGKTECWEVRGDMSAAELLGDHPSGPWGRSKVEVVGTLSAPGEFGNMGTCTRLLTVTEVLSVQHLRQGP